MDLSIMVEGQRGLTWEKWMRFSTAVEELGFLGLFRSDHFVDAEPPDQASLELWVSLTWLADNTRRIKFGPLVTPFSFRHPVHTARMAKDLNVLSGGRIVLGLGAGWGGAVREHEMFGFDLLSVTERFQRFEEGLQVIHLLLRGRQPQSFEGKYFTLKDASFQPFDDITTRIPILIGGNGPKRVLPLAARYADEWNSIYRTPKQFEELNRKLDNLLDEIGRDQCSLRRSQMMGIKFGVDQKDLLSVLAGKTIDAERERGLLAGCASEIKDQITLLEEAGVEHIIIQWPDVTDIGRLETFADNLLRQRIL
jgi:F420-dependent oxidoreductase-like protein